MHAGQICLPVGLSIHNRPRGMVPLVMSPSHRAGQILKRLVMAKHSHTWRYNRGPLMCNHFVSSVQYWPKWDRTNPVFLYSVLLNTKYGPKKKYTTDSHISHVHTVSHDAQQFSLSGLFMRRIQVTPIRWIPGVLLMSEFSLYLFPKQCTIQCLL